MNGYLVLRIRQRLMFLIFGMMFLFSMSLIFCVRLFCMCWRIVVVEVGVFFIVGFRIFLVCLFQLMMCLFLFFFMIVLSFVSVWKFLLVQNWLGKVCIIVFCMWVVIFQFIRLISWNGFIGRLSGLKVFLMFVIGVFLQIVWVVLFMIFVSRWFMMKLGVLVVSIVFLFRFFVIMNVVESVVFVVVGVFMILISGMIVIGLKKWKLIRCLGCVSFVLIFLIDSDEVLVVRIVFLVMIFLILLNICCLMLIFLKIVLIMKLQFVQRFLLVVLVMRLCSLFVVFVFMWFLVLSFLIFLWMQVMFLLMCVWFRLVMSMGIWSLCMNSRVNWFVMRLVLMMLILVIFFVSCLLGVLIGCFVCFCIRLNVYIDVVNWFLVMSFVSVLFLWVKFFVLVLFFVLLSSLRVVQGDFGMVLIFDFSMLCVILIVIGYLVRCLILFGLFFCLIFLLLRMVFVYDSEFLRQFVVGKIVLKILRLNVCCGFSIWFCLSGFEMMILRVFLMLIRFGSRKVLFQLGMMLRKILGSVIVVVDVLIVWYVEFSVIFSLLLRVRLFMNVKDGMLSLFSLLSIL